MMVGGCSRDELLVRQQFRQASHHATKVFPGPVGELLSREILSWEEFVHRFGSDGLMMQVVADILQRSPADTEAETAA